MVGPWQSIEYKVYVVMYVNNRAGSKFSCRPSRPITSDVGHSVTDSLSRYRQRHLSERRQPATDLNDVEPDSDSDTDVIPPTPVDRR